MRFGNLFGKGFRLAALACLSPWLFVPAPRLRRTARGAAAEGYFPGVEVEVTEPPNRGSLLEKLQDAIPEDENVEEHTEEVKLLREQTAILAQELRLLKELLQDGALADAISDLQLEPKPASPKAASPKPASDPAAPLFEGSCSFTRMQHKCKKVRNKHEDH